MVCPGFGSWVTASILEQLPMFILSDFPEASETVNPSFKTPVIRPFPVTVLAAPFKHEKSAPDPADPAPWTNGYPNLAVQTGEKGLITESLLSGPLPSLTFPLIGLAGATFWP